MIITRAMSTQQTAITGVLRRITVGQEIKAGLCRGPGAAPRTDPSVRNYRTGLLPRVLAARATLGWGRTMRAEGNHVAAIRPYRAQVIRCRWLRRRSVSNQCRRTWSRKAVAASMLPGTA